MKFFLDTEFIESGPGKPIQLISVALVNEHGEGMYAVSSEYNPADASDWVKENVLANLAPRDIPAEEIHPIPLKEIAKMVIDFVDKYGDREGVEFWGYYADYDWVVFCQIFGTMMDLPKGFPMYCRDLKQWCDELGKPKLPEQGEGEHNALQDAFWNRIVHKFLAKLVVRRGIRCA